MDIDKLRQTFNASTSGVTWRTPVIGGYKEGYKWTRSHEPRTFGEPVLVDEEDKQSIAAETDRHRLAKVVRHHKRRSRELGEKLVKWKKQDSLERYVGYPPGEFDYISWHDGMAELAEKRILEIMLVEGTDG